MAAMNRGLNLPSIQKIMTEFEKESATMDMKEEMMSEAVDDVMDDDGLEDEEEEGDKILKEVLDEIGVNLSQQVRHVTRPRALSTNTDIRLSSSPTRHRVSRQPPRSPTSDKPSASASQLVLRSVRHPQPQAQQRRQSLVPCPTRTNCKRDSTICAGDDDHRACAVAADGLRFPRISLHSSARMYLLDRKPRRHSNQISTIVPRPKLTPRHILNPTTDRASAILTRHAIPDPL